MEISTRRISVTFNVWLPAVTFGRRAKRRELQVRHAPSNDEPSNLSLNPELIERRAEALRTMFPYLFGWLSSRNQLADMHKANEFLSDAATRAELDQRIRFIERRMPAH